MITPTKKFVLYKTEIKNQLRRKFKMIKSDQVGKYVTLKSEYYTQHEIRHEITSPYSPYSKGVVE